MTIACCIEQNKRALYAARVRTRSRGYTLTELMAVVLIVGILATLAVYGTRKYVLSSKTAEAVSMISNIRAAEEAYRDETFRYRGLASFESWHPANDSAGRLWDWNADNGAISEVFQDLGVTPTGPVRFVYTVVAGDVGSTIPELPTASKKADFNFPAVTGPYYIVAAKADFDGTGRLTYVLAHSYSSAVHIEE